MFLRIAIIFLILMSSVNAKHLHSEKFYQDLWCKENLGQTEVKMIDNTRVDCLTKTHAIEFDFASKWAEAIGQSLHYSRLTGKTAGIVLILENKEDYKHLAKIKPLCEKYEISLFEMTPPTKNAPDEIFTLEQIFELILNFILNLISLFLKTLETLL